MNIGQESTRVDLDARQKLALRDVERSRQHLRDARRGYHLALVIADECGVPRERIAFELDTKPSYVSNAIEQHRRGKCGCRD